MAQFVFDLVEEPVLENILERIRVLDDRSEIWAIHDDLTINFPTCFAAQVAYMQRRMGPNIYNCCSLKKPPPSQTRKYGTDSPRPT